MHEVFCVSGRFGLSFVKCNYGNEFLLEPPLRKWTSVCSVCLVPRQKGKWAAGGCGFCHGASGLYLSAASSHYTSWGSNLPLIYSIVRANPASFPMMEALENRCVLLDCSRNFPLHRTMESPGKQACWATGPPIKSLANTFPACQGPPYVPSHP